MTLGMFGELFSLKWCDDVFVCFKRKFQLFYYIMEDVSKDFGVALITNVAGPVHSAQIFSDRNKGGVLSVGHGADTLNKERMTGVEIDAPVGILAALSHDHP